MRTALLYLLLSCALAIPSLSAQAVRGQVVEQGSTKPVNGAFVVLDREDGSRHAATLTNPEGRFFLNAIPGRFRLRVERIGHASTLSPC